MIDRLKYIFTFAIISLSAVGVRGEVTARIAGLADNGDYMTLLEQESAVVKTKDSLSEEYIKALDLYNSNSGDAKSSRQRVLDLEQELIDLRVRKSAISKQINTIEQEWLIDNQLSSSPSTTPAVAVESSPTTESGEMVEREDAMRITQSRTAQRVLSPLELKGLEDAEVADQKVAAIANRYVSNYTEMARLGEECMQGGSREIVDSLISIREELNAQNIALGRDIDQGWSSVYDSKSFGYMLLMDKLGVAKEMFSREEQLRNQSIRMVDSLSSKSTSSELLRYYAGRLSLVEFEISTAERLMLPTAVDSLRGVRDSMLLAEFYYPDLTLDDRVFITYEPIKFSTKAVYTSSNPIPNGEVYDRGVIYRLLVGAYKSRQAASIFRGAYPICIIKDDKNQLCYYLGGYESLSEANEAREELLKHGFRRPEVVEWRDGESRNLTAIAKTTKARYRVEINGSSELSDKMRSTIESEAAGREISKIGTSTFIVGIFDNQESAEHLVESLKTIGEDISASVVEVM